MNTTPLPPTDEDEAFEAISRKQEQHYKTYGEAWVWLPEGEYTESKLRELVASFDRMREHRKKAFGV